MFTNFPDGGLLCSARFARYRFNTAVATGAAVPINAPVRKADVGGPDIRLIWDLVERFIGDNVIERFPSSAEYREDVPHRASIVPS
jgi:hypothetical protein